MASQKFGFWCLCGAAMTGEVGGSQEVVAKVLEDGERLFRKLHRGEGHGRADMETARSVRRRKERLTRAEVGEVPVPGGIDMTLLPAEPDGPPTGMQEG